MCKEERARGESTDVVGSVLFLYVQGGVGRIDTFLGYFAHKHVFRRNKEVLKSFTLLFLLESVNLIVDYIR